MAGTDQPCVECERVLPLKDFDLMLSGNRRKRCRRCRNRENRRRNPNRERNRESARRRHAADPSRQHSATMRYKFGFGLEGYYALLEAQGGKCAMCGRTDSGSAKSARFNIDHDHACCPGEVTCGKCVRGLLCMPCNTGLGILEQEGLIEKALAYLDQYRKP